MRTSQNSTPFRPTTPPPGRLVRLSALLATATDARLRRLAARLCDQAGIGAIWLDIGNGKADPRTDLATELLLTATGIVRAQVGVSVDMPAHSAAWVVALVSPLLFQLGPRLELTLRPTTKNSATELAEQVRVIREALTSGEESPNPSCVVSLLASTPAHLSAAAASADDVVLTGVRVADVTASMSELRAACEAETRDPATLGVGIVLPVSIGRTLTEARARADRNPRLLDFGDPADGGLFGTLEDAQRGVVELAHAGVTDLRCALPLAEDIADVVAQVTALTVGSLEILSPDAPMSQAPPPPATWGGRQRGA